MLDGDARWWCWMVVMVVVGVVVVGGRGVV